MMRLLARRGQFNTLTLTKPASGETPLHPPPSPLSPRHAELFLRLYVKGSNGGTKYPVYYYITKGLLTSRCHLRHRTSPRYSIRRL